MFGKDIPCENTQRLSIPRFLFQILELLEKSVCHMPWLPILMEMHIGDMDDAGSLEPIRQALYPDLDPL